MMTYSWPLTIARNATPKRYAGSGAATTTPNTTNPIGELHALAEVCPAVDVDGLAGDVARAGADQKARQRREVFRPGCAAEQRPVERMRRNFVRLAGLSQHRRNQRVDGDLVRAQFHGEPAGE